MASRMRGHLPGAQRGLALLMLLVIVSASASYMLVKALNKNSAAVTVARNKTTQDALIQAKQALLTYVATVGAEKAMDPAGVPGFLPCPDLGASLTTLNAEGLSDASCGGSGRRLVSEIGRLPWYTLGLDALKDDSDECLWYAVSGTYKPPAPPLPTGNGVTTSPSTSNMMNWDTRGLFDVLADGGVNYLTGGSSNPATRAVAVIFAPGQRLNAQDRTPTAFSAPNTGAPNCGGNYTVGNYLESANSINNASVSSTANTIVQFIAGKKSDTFDDQLIYITRDELWAAIKKRPDFQKYLTGIPPSDIAHSIAYKVAYCLANFGNNNYNFSSGDRRIPYAAANSLSTTPLSTYMLDASYADRSRRLVGRVPFSVANSRSGSVTSTRPQNYLAGSPYNLISLSAFSFGTTPCFPTPVLPESSNSSSLAWYENWKDHLFYAVSAAYQPRATPNPYVVASCTAANCVQVNGTGTRYAGIVIFAGERLSTQSRETAAQRADPSNYLEGRNAANIELNTGSSFPPAPAAIGNENYQTGASSTTFNDVAYCIPWNYNVATTVFPVLCP